jgi:LysM repeat protein
VVQKAGKAAPALAVVGAIAAGPHVPKTANLERTTATAPVLDARLDAAILPAHEVGRTYTVTTYTVKPGDSLCGIARRFYGRAADWPTLYQANRAKIHHPGLIYPGQVLRVPRDPAAPVTGHRTDGDKDNDGDRSDRGPYKPRHSRAGSPGGGRGQGAGHHLNGTLNCRGLEALWRSAGGASWAAVTAASIAMAESGGHQYATGSAGERGYWQINPVNGALSTYNAYGNARAAVIMSHDGTNWSAWTTWVDGAYRGRC